MGSRLGGREGVGVPPGLPLGVSVHECSLRIEATICESLA